MKPKKIYCCDCKHYFAFGGYCSLIDKIEDTPFKQITIYHDYEILNKNNNCKYYAKDFNIDD